MELVTFILTTKHPTSYQKADGTFFDTPVRKRIIPEYTYKSEDGTMAKCRHIRNENSIYVKDQTSTFNNRVDNIYFSHGICVLDPIKDKVTIEFLRKHPMNEDQPDSNRTIDVFPCFREMQRELEGLSEIDKLYVVKEATNLAMELRRKDGSYDPRLKFYAKVFKLDGSLAPSEQIIALVKKAQDNPKDFIHRVNSKWENMENDLESAIRLGIVSITGKNAFLQNDTILTFKDEISEDEMKAEVMSYFLSNEGEDKYKELGTLIDREALKAKEASKASKVKSTEKVKESIQAEIPQTEKQ